MCIDGYLELRRRLMKTVFLHGLGQTAQDWKEVVQQLSISDVDCPELFSSTEDEISYSQILGDLEQRYSEVKEPLRICGLSLGALLAIDFAILLTVDCFDVLHQFAECSLVCLKQVIAEGCAYL